MNALVMYDHQTDTLWSQFLGKGVKGPLTGKSLELLPLSHTTWDTWKSAHPDTLVLDKRGQYQHDRYTGYYASAEPGVIGERIKDDRLQTKALVVGVNIAGHTKAYPLGTLAKQGVVNDKVGGVGIVVVFDRSSNTSVLYESRASDRELTFEAFGEWGGPRSKLRDHETGTIWTAFTGVATDGPLAGTKLKRVQSHLSFWFAWTDWNPETELYTDNG